MPVGQIFGRLKIIAPGNPLLRSDGRREHRWRAECTCGEIFDCLPHQVRKGVVKSCGCLVKDIGRESFIRLRAERSPPQIWLVDGIVASIEINGRTIRVDAADLPLVSNIRWYLNGCGYVVTGKPERPLHHVVLGTMTRTDHSNGDTLDNRRDNLRPATSMQNARNARKTNRPTSSQYKGVSLYRRNRYRCFEAQICVARQKIYLGRYDIEEDAARAYDEAARKNFGEFARTNFN